MNTNNIMKRFIYWLNENDLAVIKPDLISRGYKLSSAKMTPCETLSAHGKKLIFATPKTWSRMCIRQGSWYRESDKSGKTLLVSEHRLPSSMDAYLDECRDACLDECVDAWMHVAAWRCKQKQNHVHEQMQNEIG